MTQSSEPGPVEGQSFPIWSDPANAPTERAPISEDPTGESNAEGGGGDPDPDDGLALGWDVEITGAYMLAVDGVSTTELTQASTLEEVEVALNETSGPVGLDVSGDPSTLIQVSTDTPAALTATGLATVTVTQENTPGGL